MKTTFLVSVSAVTALMGVAHAREPLSISPKKDTVVSPCLLGSKPCPELSTIPVQACPIAGRRGHEAKGACAVDGMKLVDKLIV